MLESALRFKHPFISLALSDKNDNYYPLSEEWRREEIIYGILKPFYEITALILGSSYLRSNLYFG